MPLRHRIVAMLCGPVFCASAASAQMEQVSPSDSAARDPRLGVYVRDSAVAAEKLALAQRMERLKEWDKSADVYQEIVEKYADRVVPVLGGDEDTKRYTSVTLAVQELLGKWPDAGLTEYRARFETPAATMLESAGSDDAAALSRVMQTYFPTDAAKQAAMRLIELYIESGEFGAAAWTGERLLSHHPGIEVDRPRILFRTALAQHLAGTEADAKAKLAQLKSKHADATGTFRGEDVNLAQELEKLLATPAAVARGGISDSWPTLGGDVTRGRVPDAAGRPGAKLVDIPLVRARQRPLNNPQQRAQLDADTRNRRDAGLSLAIIPVIDRGELFYQDGGRVYARGLESGLPLPGWAATYPDDARPRYASQQANALVNLQQYGGVLPSAASQATVTVTEHSVLAVLSPLDGSLSSARIELLLANGGVRDSQLVCLDRANGARKWSVSPTQFPESLANLRNLMMGGSPLVVGENVYVAARGGKPMQFEDAYVLCINLADGKLKWACYLASGNAPDGNMNGIQMAMSSAGISHLAFSGGRIYAVSNIGAVAAVDAYAGTIVWLSIYPRPGIGGGAVMMRAFGGRNPGSPYASIRKPWAQNPAIVRDGKVFALPSDAQHALVYDADNGREIKRIDMAHFDRADTLLGVVGEKLIVSGPRNIYCINWPKYDPERKASENIIWLSTPAGPGETQNEERIRGRGFVTADSVFIPTKWNLRRIDLETGRAESRYPQDGEWGVGEGPGNVLVTGDQVIIAGADAISVYSDLALARAKLDRAIEAAPNDALPRLKYAEMLFAAGYLDPAVEKLDEAIRLLGGVKAMRPGAERDRVFARALAFAERSADPKAGASDATRATALYERAAAAASAPQQQVAYRLGRARFARQQRDFPQEVRLLQEILSDASYRSVTVPAEDGTGTTSASTVAESGIAQRIGDMPSAYAPFEAAAADALAQATQNRSAEQMLAVAETYPNAKVAPQAMLAAADAFESTGRNRLATQVLNRAYYKYGDSGDKARIIEAQARNYLALPNGIGVAIGRLKEGAKIPGDLRTLQHPLKLPDGQTIENISFAAAAEMLQRFSARVAAASLPDFRIPATWDGDATRAFLPERPEWVIADVDQLLVPPRELRDFIRHERVVTWSGGKGLSIYAVGENRPLATSDALKSAPRGSAWLAGAADDAAKARLLVWTADTLFLFTGDALALNWSARIQSLPTAEMYEPNDDPAERDAAMVERGVIVAPGVMVIDNQVVNIRRGRQIVMQGRVLNIGGARPRPPEGAAEQIEHVRPVGDRVVFASSTGRIGAIDLSNGQLAWQTRLGEAPFDQLVGSDDFVAVRFTDDFGAQIIALETFGGEVVWRQSFGPETALPPLNMTIAPDGTLLYTLPDRVCGKDLYEPGKELRFGKTPLSGDQNRMFETSFGPDQLVVSEGRILAVADQGTFVRQLSLEDGKEIPGANPLGTNPGATPTNLNVWIRAVGPRVYVFNSRTVMGYNLDRLDESWPGIVEAGQQPSVRNAFIGKRHLVLLDQPMPREAAEAGVAPILPGGAAPAAPPGTRFRLLAYGRYPTAAGKNDESGKLDQTIDVTHPVGIDQWQPVEGGFYYRSVDRKAHFLKGAEAESADREAK